MMPLNGKIRPYGKVTDERTLHPKHKIPYVEVPFEFMNELPDYYDVYTHQDLLISIICNIEDRPNLIEPLVASMKLSGLDEQESKNTVETAIKKISENQYFGQVIAFCKNPRLLPSKCLFDTKADISGSRG